MTSKQSSNGQKTPSADDEVSMHGGRNLSEKSLQIRSSVSQVSVTEPAVTSANPQQTVEEEVKVAGDAVSMTEAGSPLHTTQNVSVSFSPYDQYMYQVVQNMVDDVCLFQGRQEFVREKYLSQINDLENSADLEEKQQLEELMRKELEGINLKSVPPKVSSKKDEAGGNKVSKKHIPVDIKNEIGI